jgi:hypothetical protein
MKKCQPDCKLSERIIALTVNGAGQEKFLYIAFVVSKVKT